LDHYEDSFLSISNTVALFATGVAAISAIVAGIGVMNTMLSAIDTRTHEIGVYIALGARKSDLIKNFFLETCITCALGGLLGSGIYVSLFILLQQKIGAIIQVETIQIIFGIGIAISCGVIFGIIPAIKVSKKDPIMILKPE
jgi:ABC-type antimicrobial peptide transport system permease subunit